VRWSVVSRRRSLGERRNRYTQLKFSQTANSLRPTSKTAPDNAITRIFATSVHPRIVRCWGSCVIAGPSPEHPHTDPGKLSDRNVIIQVQTERRSGHALNANGSEPEDDPARA
jgi:hypothetical protein